MGALRNFLKALVFLPGVYFLVITPHTRDFWEPPAIAVFFFMVIGNVSGTILHEAGHWIAGMAVGWRGLRFRIGPYALVRGFRGWRIRWIKWDLGGGVTFAPMSLEGFRKADSILAAGGPAASLLAGLLCGTVAWFANSGLVFWLAGTTSLWSWLAVLELLPAQVGWAKSDGFWLWQLTRGGEELERRQRYMLANMTHGTDLRPRDWPRSLMDPVLTGPVPGPDRHDAYLAYIHLIDSDDPEAAFPWLAGVLQQSQKTDPPEYALEGAYYAAVYGGDAALAAKWLACAGTDDVSPWVRLRAEAAVASAQGRAQGARRLVDYALLKLEEIPLSGHRAYETARLNDLVRHASECVLTATAS